MTRRRSELHIALLQLPGAGRNVAANLAAGLAALRDAAAQDADIAVLPELFQIGYDIEGDRRWVDLAIDVDAPFVQAFRDAARELNLAVVVTFLERSASGPRNTAALVDRHGEIVLQYSKTHTCDFDIEAALEPGTELGTATLDTRAGPVQVGMLICFDREFPEPSRLLMLDGAEVVLIPNACDLDEDRVAQMRTRAFENMFVVATANYSAPTWNGRSSVFDGMVYEADEKVRDQRAVEAGPGPAVVLGTVDLDALRAYRAREVWGDAYRRPRLYGPLAATGPSEAPFTRSDSRR